MTMTRPKVRILLVLVVLAAARIAAGGMQQATPPHATGLILATPEQLRGVPLASTPYSGAELPSSADLSDNMPPPQNQGRQNSCVAWAVAYALKSYEERVEEGLPIVRPNGQIDAQRVFSPSFIYNQINNGRDGGSRFQDALNLVHDQGAATWADMPYDPQDYTRRPNAAALASARRFRIDTWRQVNVQDTREMKAQIAAGYPVLVGVRVDDGFMNAGPGFVWRAAQAPTRGGHAVIIVGYDDQRQAFKLLNSWGPQWGDRGYGWVSYDHLRLVAGEAYVAKDARNGPAPAVVAPPPPPPPNPFDRNPPPPPPVRDVQFAITAVSHNAILPADPAAGYFMRIDGSLVIPPGMGSTDQVVISFWFDAGNGQKGQQVRSLAAAYATVYGQAACGTARYPIPPQGLQTTWAAWIPYAAMLLPSGQWLQTPTGPMYSPVLTRLIAEPVLYIDNFGVKTGGQVPFGVNR